MKQLEKSDINSYATYSFTSGLAVMAPMSYFIVFLTENLFMSAALMGTLILVTRLIDLIVGTVAGGVIQSSRSKHKYSFWFGTLRWVVFTGIILSFTNTSALPIAARVLISAIAYCMINCSMNFVASAQYNILAVMSGPSIDNRNKLSFRSTQFMAAATILTSMLTLPSIKLLSAYVGNSNGYLIVATVLAIPFIFGCQKLIKASDKFDTVSSGPKLKITVKDMIKSVATNSQLLVVMLAYSLFYIGMFTTSAVMAYYFIYVLGNYLFMTVAMTIRTIFALAASILGPKIGVKLGKKRAMVVGLSLYGIGYFCIYFFASGSLAVYIVFSCIMSIAMYLFSGFTVNYMLDAGEYHLNKTGQDNRGVAMGMMNVPMKIGMMIGGAIGGYGLSIAGYTAGMTASTSFISKFMVIFGIVPGVFCFLSALVMMVGHRISDADAARYAKENAERMAAAKAGLE